MPGNGYEFERATPVLRVADYETSKRFWVDLLGFAVIEEGGDPPRFGIFRRGGAVVFVNAWDGVRTPHPAGWDAYFHVGDLEGFHAHLSKQLQNLDPIRDTVYGMREFELQDPDGNRLCFGMDVPGA